MSSLIRVCLLILVISPLAATSVRAQWFSGARHACCGTCRQPRPQCGCTTFKPVVSTTYRTERQITYRNETRTAYRREAQTERVAVTRRENVTVDEGGYQMVWVAKPVTRSVARTEWQNSISYRDVPYQVTHRVPQVSTKLVPQQTVRYVPQTVRTVMAAPRCNTCQPTAWNSHLHTAYSGYPSPYATATLPRRHVARPLVAPDPPREATSSSPGGLTPSPVHLETPELADEKGNWITIKPKSANTRTTSNDDRFGDYQVAPRVSSRPAAAGKFSPVPSAASVWQTRGAILR
jgi:hypothetical protein